MIIECQLRPPVFLLPFKVMSPVNTYYFLLLNYRFWVDTVQVLMSYFESKQIMYKVTGIGIPDTISIHRLRA